MNSSTNSTMVSDGAYFEHYARLNDLSPDGRRRLWRTYRSIFGTRLPTDREAKIVDVGCAAGQFIEWLRVDLGYKNVHGIEKDERLASFASSHGIDDIEVCDLMKWNPPEKCDCLILKDVLEHMPSGQQIESLRLLSNHLRPGGSLIIRVPNAGSTFAAHHRYIDVTHFRSYSEYSLRSELEQAGFVSVAIFAEDVWLPQSALGAMRLAVKGLARILRRIEAISEYGSEGFKIPLSLNIIAVAKV